MWYITILQIIYSFIIIIVIIIITIISRIADSAAVIICINIVWSVTILYKLSTSPWHFSLVCLCECGGQWCHYMCHGRLQCQIFVCLCCMLRYYYLCNICFHSRCWSKVALSHVCQNICSTKVILFYCVNSIDIIVFTLISVIVIIITL